MSVDSDSCLFFQSNLCHGAAAWCVIQPCLLDVNTYLDLIMLMGFPCSAENQKHTILGVYQSRIMLKSKSIS